MENNEYNFHPEYISLPDMSKSDVKISLDDQGRLHWPVIFLYPEYQQSDLITDFMEDEIFQVHLENMFPSTQLEPAVPWDKRCIYKAKYLELYFEFIDKESSSCKPQLISLEKSSTLLSLLSHPYYRVQNGIPKIIVLCSESSFRNEFLAKYDK
jgi:hypothetical protein